MIESSGGNWSDVQQYSASTTTLGQETDDDDDDERTRWELAFRLLSESTFLVSFLSEILQIRGLNPAPYSHLSITGLTRT